MIFLFCLFFHYKERDSYSCPVCFSRQHVYQWRLGLWIGMSLPLTPAWQITEESKLLGNIIDEKHQHNWEFYQGSPYYFFGTTWGGCALGGGRRANDIVELYNEEQGFRDLISKKIISDKLSRERFLELCSFDRYSSDDKDEKTIKTSIEYYELLNGYRDQIKK